MMTLPLSTRARKPPLRPITRAAVSRKTSEAVFIGLLLAIGSLSIPFIVCRANIVFVLSREKLS